MNPMNPLVSLLSQAGVNDGVETHIDGRRSFVTFSANQRVYQICRDHFRLVAAWAQAKLPIDDLACAVEIFDNEEFSERGTFLSALGKSLKYIRQKYDERELKQREEKDREVYQRQLTAGASRVQQENYEHEKKRRDKQMMDAHRRWVLNGCVDEMSLNAVGGYGVSSMYK
jgi:hypothetical protein